MTILHICGDFPKTTVHFSLFKQLDAIGIRQIVYVPLKSYIYQNNLRTIDFLVDGSRIIYSPIERKYHKAFYESKIRTIFNDLSSKVDLATIDVVHSTCLCKEGGVAYMLNMQFHIPYVTAVRNTDINDYFKVFFWRRVFFEKILSSASKIVLISPIYQQRLFDIITSNARTGIQSKLRIVSNGIQDVFLENRTFKDGKLQKPIQLVYAGGIDSNKNITNVLHTVSNLRDKGYNIEYSIIGKGFKGREELNKVREVDEYAKTHSWLHIYDVQPSYELVKSLRKYDIFIMVSFHETFGLSYAEAISQGLPIIYTKGEGFDGVFERNEMGYGTEPNDLIDIQNAILNTINNYHTLCNNIAHADLNRFSWKQIAYTYSQMYVEVNNDNKVNICQ